MIFQSDPEPVGPRPYEPRLSFTPACWRRLVLYTLGCPFEIGGLGLLERRGRDFVMTDALVVEQDVDDISTRLDGGAVSRLLAGMVERGQDPAGLKVWWHSHAGEAPFWSGVDEQTIERFQNDFMVSLVTNHELRALARLDRYAPRRTSWVWVDRPPGEPEVADGEAAAIRAEIEAKTRHVPRATTRIW